MLDHWVKPNLTRITPEWEHMMRCITTGIRYYYPGASFEGAVLDLAEILNLSMPIFQKSLSYSLRIRRFFIRFFFLLSSFWIKKKKKNQQINFLHRWYVKYALRFDNLRIRFNDFLEKKIERALKFDAEKHEELKRKSKDTLGGLRNDFDDLII